MANMMQKEKVIAIIGASNNPEKFGNKIYLDLKKKGYKVIPINPKETSIAGDKCYASVLDYEGQIFTADLVVPASIGISLLDEFKRKGIKNLWFQPGAESDELLEKAEKMGFDIVSGACMMQNEL